MSRRKNPKGGRARGRQPSGRRVSGGASNWKNLLICGFLAVATVAAFAGATGNGFVWDDHEYVVVNQGIKDGVNLETVVWAFTAEHSANWHPVTWLSHALDIEIYGLDAAGHHRTNLLIHVLTVVLLFLILQRMTGATWRSAAVAVIFAVHPLRVESVAWISERKDVLSALFWVATMGAYAWYVRKPTRARYAAGLILFFLGLMSKQMLVTLPFVLLLLDVWPLGRLRLPWVTDGSLNGVSADSTTSRSAGQLVLEKLPYFALAVTGAVVAAVAQGRGGAVGSLEVFPLALRLQNALVSTVAYIGKLIWPESLSIFYPYRTEIQWWQLVLSLLVVLTMTVVAIRSFRRRPYIAVGWFWYIGTLAPVIGLVQIGEQAMADRYTYIPCIGLLILVCWWLPDVLGRWPAAQPVLAILVVGVAVAFAVQTHRQVEHWQSDQTLFEYTIDTTPGNYLAHLNLGMALVRQGRLDEAEPHFRRALEIKPDHVLAHNNLGMVALRRGRAGEAAERFERAVKLDSGENMYRFNLAMALAASGDLDGAAKCYAEARSNDPSNPRFDSELGVLMAQVGTSLLFERQFVAAATLLGAAVRLEPDLPGAHVAMAHAELALGHVDEALGHYERAVHLKPSPDQEYFGFGTSLAAQAHFGYGHTLAAVGEASRAEAQYREALRLMPEMVSAKTGLAWLLATAADDGVRDAVEAVRLATDAIQRSGNRDPKALDALAAANASDGRFDRAVELAQSARAIAQAAGRPALAEAISRRLEGYRLGQPYTERAINLAE